MGLEFAYDYGQTPLTADELEGLIPKHITTHQELNEWESTNILEGRNWAFSQRHKDILSICFVLKLHKQMFSETWTWAGTYRTSEKYIGVAPYQISTDLQILLDNVKYWQEHETYSFDEIGARLHYKMTWIHPFNNGNGRHARLFADLFMHQNSKDIFSWGSNQIIAPKEIRRQYIDALKEADKKNLEPLIHFVRS